MMAKKVKKAVIPAAGLGTRFLPASKVVPKELFTLVDRPILQFIVDEAVAAGVEEIILVVSPRKKRLAEYFADDPDLERFLEEKGQTSILARLHESHVPVRITVVVQEDPKGLI